MTINVVTWDKITAYWNKLSYYYKLYSGYNSLGYNKHGYTLNKDYNLGCYTISDQLKLKY